jgi:beta-lactamase regulating signal transducer with metallopeptidase domain
MIDGWMAAMVRASWQGAIAVVLVWIVCKSAPRLPANARCWLWRLALLKTLLAAMPLGSFDVPILPRGWGERETAGAGVTASVAEAASANAVMRNFATNSDSDTLREPATTASAIDGSAVNRGKTVRTPIGVTILFAAWVAVLAAFLGTIAVRIRGARRWRREWRLIKEHGILAMGERLSERLGLFQPPVLFEADSCGSPVVFGAVRTSIVLPARLVAGSTPGQLELILAHEMAHIRRYDLLGNWFSTLVSGLFFFHPLVWLAVRESRLSQEVACDELAVRRPGVSVADYGRLLVELATQRPTPAIPLVTVGVVESFQTFLKRRLSAMKSIGTRSRRTFVLSWAVAIVAVLGLLPWRLAAEPKADAKPAAKAPGEQRVNVETKSGQFKIAVERVRYVPGHMISMVPTALPMLAGKMEQHVEEHSFPGGMARAVTGGMGGGGGGVITVPNLILDVVVKGPKLAKKHQLVCEVQGKVHAVDDRGRDVDSSDNPSWLKLQLQDVDYPQGSGRTAIHLNLPRSDPEAQYLKTVEGQLLVADAAINEITFQGSDLTQRTKKRAGAMSARLDKVEEAPDGIVATLAVFEPEKHEEINPMGNPMEMMQKMMMGSAGGRVRVTLLDSEGKTHTAEPQGKKSAGQNGVTFFGGGGRGGGSSGSWRRVGPHGVSGGSFSSSNPKVSEPQEYHFGVLPAGVKMKSITCTVTDISGKPKTVPFKFKDIRLPERR